jgi:hypothetical protein
MVIISQTHISKHHIVYLLFFAQHFILRINGGVFLFIYPHVHTLFGSFLPPAPAPTLSSLLSSLPGRTCSALFSSSVEE